MDITQEQMTEAILSVTGGPDWEIVKKVLLADIYNIQAGALDAKSWEAVCEARGFAAALAYIVNLRETTISAMNEENRNANL